ncbi:MAG: glycosyltransferase [Gemmatimonadetes bacterium]|nr:glycosyltransferase [Gemmatimonadota bacterium]
MKTDSPRITVIIPVRNGSAGIAALVRAVRAQGDPDALEIVVVDDGSTDGTDRCAKDAGARVLRLADSPGNPAVARNHGAKEARGDWLAFIDADCMPDDRWLAALVRRAEEGYEVVGGSLGMPPGLAWSARLDYIVSSYHTHPKRPPGLVPNHSPANLFVRRDLFLGTSMFEEKHPAAYAHEELIWQGEVLRSGGRIFFEPAARVDHENRPGLLNVFKRNYRWGYSAVYSKAKTGAARAPGLYRFPIVPALLAVPAAPLIALYIMYCWLRAGEWEIVPMAPFLLGARFAHGAGSFVGYFRGGSERRPGWE